MRFAKFGFWALLLCQYGTAATVNLASGDSITLGGTTVSCNVAVGPGKCENFGGYIYCTDSADQSCTNFGGYIYCGYNCTNFGGYIYCSNGLNERCENFGGYIYCGHECQNFGGYIYCDGQKATPAVPAKPAKPR